jgi:hypothetical protein
LIATFGVIDEYRSTLVAVRISSSAAILSDGGAESMLRRV